VAVEANAEGRALTRRKAGRSNVIL